MANARNAGRWALRHSRTGATVGRQVRPRCRARHKDEPVGCEVVDVQLRRFAVAIRTSDDLNAELSDVKARPGRQPVGHGVGRTEHTKHSGPRDVHDLDGAIAPQPCRQATIGRGHQHADIGRRGERNGRHDRGVRPIDGSPGVSSSGVDQQSARRSSATSCASPIRILVVVPSARLISRTSPSATAAAMAWSGASTSASGMSYSTVRGRCHAASSSSWHAPRRSLRRRRPPARRGRQRRPAQFLAT